MQPIAESLQPAVWPNGLGGSILPKVEKSRKSGVIRKMTKSRTSLILVAAIVMFISVMVVKSATPAPAVGPEYTADAQLKLPENYREWTYLTTGFDMSYSPNAQQMDHHMFDNVFVNPEAYKAFVQSGTWPDKTMLVLEQRMVEGEGSINQKGNYQGTDVMGREIHVKDEARFPGKWAFFIFDDAKTAKMVATDMACYSCHSEHAAVDTTFVQFYPTLLPIARSKGTLSAGYAKESGAGQK